MVPCGSASSALKRKNYAILAKIEISPASECTDTCASPAVNTYTISYLHVAVTLDLPYSDTFLPFYTKWRFVRNRDSQPVIVSRFRGCNNALMVKPARFLIRNNDNYSAPRRCIHSAI